MRKAEMQYWASGGGVIVIGALSGAVIAQDNTFMAWYMGMWACFQFILHCAYASDVME